MIGLVITSYLLLLGSRRSNTAVRVAIQLANIKLGTMEQSAPIIVAMRSAPSAKSELHSKNDSNGKLL
jgi:hypothetical protein